MQLPVKLRVSCRKAVGVFRQTAALRPLLGNHVPIKGAEHLGCHGRFWFFFLAEYAEKSLSLWLLWLFLHTFLHDYGNLTGYLLVEDLLFVKHLNNPAHLLFLIFEKMAHAVDALCRINRFEAAQHTVHCHATGMVMLQIFIIPLQHRFTQ